VAVAACYLVVEGSQSVREALCFLLLSFGIRGLPAAGRASALALVREHADITGAIVDIDNQDVEGAGLIAELRGNPATRGLPIIVHTIQSGRDFVMKMIESGIAGYLLKPFTADAARARLAGILSKLADHDTQRMHIRVKPDAGELIRVHFRLSGHSAMISGRMRDVSLGGMAVELFNPPEPAFLAAGTRIGKLQFSLGPRELSPVAAVVLFKSGVLALRFEGLAGADKSALERYIFKRISS
jgi:two-component system, chemotaxis family, chemotaxis protein CheY